ncbi:ubiquitin-associated domain-containing protein 2-like isoform X2 [Centruroides sculpturatus]|uniref:ubiquitin-associated domain-containing protein 2-like isoform X2 n=1 Tax=Centruroides sculpturatus TaxID=218467 RepID=UPI000C6DF4D5|nr:ubiquitin-associated domain-containing protein 2-like isoform X2 [Centruroides sculpturatus]
MAAILSQYSTTGFYKAPVSKGLFGCMFLTSCALNVPLLAHVKQYVIYSIPNIFEQYEIWRIITSKLTFLDTKDLVCGTLLIYYFRIFERRYGSHKFCSYLLAVCTVATVLELTTVYALRQLDIYISYLPTGPYELIFPLFVNYFLDIPRVAQIHIMGVPVTGKTLTYLLGLQLAGLICRWNVLRIQQWIRVPDFLSKIAALTLKWLLNSSPPQEGTLPMGATLEIQRQQQLELIEEQMLLARAQEFRERGNMQNYNRREEWENVFNMRRRQPNPREEGLQGENFSANVENESTFPVVEEQVQRLVEMGFDRQSVIRALRNSNNDINLATSILLTET